MKVSWDDDFSQDMETQRYVPHQQANSINRQKNHAMLRQHSGGEYTEFTQNISKYQTQIDFEPHGVCCLT